MAISGNNPLQRLLLNQGGGEGEEGEFLEEVFAQAFGQDELQFQNGFANGGGQQDFFQLGGDQDPMQGFLQLIEQRQQQDFGTATTGNQTQDLFNIAQQSGLIPPDQTLQGVGIDNFETYLNSVLQNGLAAGEIGQQSVLNSSQSALTNSAIQQIGMQLGLDINEWANEVNIDLDLQNLQTRSNYGVFMKQVEQYLMDEQVKEKLENMFWDLEKTKMQNRFSLAKTAAGAARYG